MGSIYSYFSFYLIYKPTELEQIFLKEPIFNYWEYLVDYLCERVGKKFILPHRHWSSKYVVMWNVLGDQGGEFHKGV